jgi:photosystem II stability/assembly factor-like uncharacterized protein
MSRGRPQTAAIVGMFLAGTFTQSPALGARDAHPRTWQSPGNWEPTAGSGAVNTTAVVIDPTEPGTVYRGGLAAGVAKSIDGGTTWVDANEGLSDLEVQVLVIDPSNPETLFAGTYGGGIFKTIDGASNWFPADEGFGDVAIYALAIDPSSSSTVYAGAVSGVWKSTDGGQHWVQMSAGLTGHSVLALAIRPNDPEVIYSGTKETGHDNGGVFRTPDGGLHWRSDTLGEEVDEHWVASLAIDPLDPETVYGGTIQSDAGSGGVFKTVDGGGTWRRVSTGFNVNALAIDPIRTGTLYAGTDAVGVYKTWDGGRRWRAVNTGLVITPVFALAITPSAPGRVYAATDGGVFRTTNGGRRWTGPNNPLADSLILTMATVPLTDTVYAGTADIGIYRSVNGGISWEVINDGLTTLDVNKIAVDPSNPTTVYAATQFGGVFKSTDGGAVWVSASTGLTDLAVFDLVVDPSNPAILYAATEYHGVSRSVDGAVQWTPVNQGLPLEGGMNVNVLAVDPLTPSTVYAGLGRPGGGTDDGVFKTTDGGAHWVRRSSGIGPPYETSVSAIAVDPEAPSTLYTGTYCADDEECTDAQLYKSTDGGASWSQSGSFWLARFRSILVDSGTPGSVFAGSSSLGVYVSTDGGGTWVETNTGLTSLVVYALVGGPSPDNDIYAGTWYGGAFRFVP